jgi:hypothetical protein
MIENGHDTGGSIPNIYEALLAERGLIIAEWLKTAVAIPERYSSWGIQGKIQPEIPTKIH